MCAREWRVRVCSGSKAAGARSRLALPGTSTEDRPRRGAAGPRGEGSPAAHGRLVSGRGQHTPRGGPIASQVRSAAPRARASAAALRWGL